MINKTLHSIFLKIKLIILVIKNKRKNNIINLKIYVVAIKLAGLPKRKLINKLANESMHKNNNK